MQRAACFLVAFSCAGPGAPIHPAEERAVAELWIDDYDAARSAFLRSAETFRAAIPATTVESRPIRYPATEGLFIDSLFVPAETSPARNLILLTSGIHGPEAPAGSVQERLLMTRCLAGAATGPVAQIDRRRTALLVIHAMNPFGFKHGRRFNGNGVDLNRNCFDYRRRPFPGKEIHNASYARHREFLEDRISGFGLALRGLFGRQDVTRALGGQYEFPSGFYYGGSEVEAECRTVEELADAHLPGVVNVAHLDFHTGLGDTGIVQLMLNPAPRGEEASAAYRRELSFLRETMFPRDECRNLCTVKEADEHDYLTSGDLSQWLHETYPEKRAAGLVISVTSEIGTEGPLTVVPALVNENYCYRHPDDCDEREREERTRDLAEALNPADSCWRLQAYRNGLQLCRALARFSGL